MHTTDRSITQLSGRRASKHPQLRAACDLRQHSVFGERTDPATAAGIRQTLADELRRLSADELSRRLRFTRTVRDEHERVWRFGAGGTAADLNEISLRGRITTTSPSWSENLRGDSALLQVEDDMALVIVRGNRHAQGETWLRPYLAIKAFYAPGAGDWR